ncbi:MAG TPA: ATP-binding protein [Thermodesulfovibrionales bacterium]|nr:ATP-binding protein [Thermodesulfovibrionales bacterium]
MDDLLKEIRRLNANLERLTDYFVPSRDPAILGRYRAFRSFSQNNRLCFRGIPEPDPVGFEELRGINPVIERLIENTEQFLEGLPANNVLLYGPRGTGKSSAIKALLNRYRKRGLKMIEMPRETLFHLPDVAEILRGRPERFIIFCDDLAFEEEEVSYRELKAVLEGGLEMRPHNMLIYATSNRRHLMPERPEDNLPVLSGGELHPAETMEEKLSLSDRFGLRLGILNFDLETYLDIVSHYAAARRITILPEDLKKKATQWSLSHGSFSGRTARQFVDDLEGRVGMKRPNEKA